jgi:hypothetical protein
MFTHSKGDHILAKVAGVGAISVLCLGDCFDGLSDGGANVFPWLLCSSRIFRFGLTVADVPQTDFYR